MFLKICCSTKIYHSAKTKTMFNEMKFKLNFDKDMPVFVQGQQKYTLKC